VAGRGHPAGARGAGDGGDEAVAHRAHRLGRNRREIGHRRPGLVAIDLLQRQHIGIQSPHAVGEPADVDFPVVDAAAVQNVEGGHPHG
jgi:hypothetical protein